ncbi:hypothetical protein M3P21_03670 [Ruegeria sp. 2012CJ41-6]|uniref:DUF4167 domain-containing protein n=1 Tax=Ruegeria spongiae TaxID=2942209 RepID=A0ABT0Q107_9RHOB|nr:hypothetical protein [Ruegeria spongiae]MCL6282619.1 hypothetical protein [Ruegeria spongiae]
MANSKSTKPKTRKPRKKGSGGSGGGNGRGYGDGGGDDEPTGEVPENLDVHEAFLKHRLEGGEEPSSQAYARAVEQFKKLPGAIRGKPAFIPPTPPDDDDGDDGDSSGGAEGKK